MTALAALPHVHVKLSGLAYIRSEWVTDPAAHAVVKGLVREIVALFGASRCMFASNFPVDVFTNKVRGGRGMGRERETEKNAGHGMCMWCVGAVIHKHTIHCAHTHPTHTPLSQVNLADTYVAMHGLVEDLPLDDRHALFHGTAERVYKLA